MNGTSPTGDPQDAFIVAGCVPRDAGHNTGTLQEAEALLAEHPELATASIHTAAILGDATAVRRFLANDPSAATRKAGPHEWDALTHLCFSRYLRLDPARAEGLVQAAEALLEAGASANTGWFEPNHKPEPGWESVLYGAAGVAHNAALTQLLLQHGADPNDGETEYHSPEGFDDAAMRAVVEDGRLASLGMVTMLIRKLDWHHYNGLAWLLDHGADPNLVSHWGNPALHHALRRGNELRILELLLDHGADPLLPGAAGLSAVAVAARMGRGDALDLFRARGFDISLTGDDQFLASCARGDDKHARAMVNSDPALVARLQTAPLALLVDYAASGNAAGVAILLDLGFPIGVRRTEPPWDAGEMPLHAAVWRDRLAVVKLLVERGADLEAKDGKRRTPLALAARAQSELGEWTPHSSTAVMEALLVAGAKVASVDPFPTGSAVADELLSRYGRT